MCLLLQYLLQGGSFHKLESESFREVIKKASKTSENYEPPSAYCVAAQNKPPGQEGELALHILLAV